MAFFWISKVEDLPAPADLHPLSMTIGNFDGVHRGHQQLLRQSMRWAKAHGGKAMALTFDPHPAVILDPSRSHVRLFDLADQKEQFEKFSLQGAFVQPFTKEFSELSAETFLQDFVCNSFHPQHLVVGHDFAFGHGRKGTLALLEKFCAQKKIELEVIPAYHLPAESMPSAGPSLLVSTSAIRTALQNGQVETAQAFLGRPFYIQGLVEKGAQRGHQVGFPTANLHPTLDFFPRNGVYITRTWLNGQAFPSITNIGVNPTFMTGLENKIRVETHIFDFSQNIYGQQIRVELLKYLRAERKFSGIDELRTQIQQDVQTARAYFS